MCSVVSNDAEVIRGEWKLKKKDCVIRMELLNWAENQFRLKRDGSTTERTWYKNESCAREPRNTNKI